MKGTVETSMNMALGTESAAPVAPRLRGRKRHALNVVAKLPGLVLTTVPGIMGDANLTAITAHGRYFINTGRLRSGLLVEGWESRYLVWELDAKGRICGIAEVMPWLPSDRITGARGTLAGKKKGRAA